MLEIRNLKASINNRSILKGLNLKIGKKLADIELGSKYLKDQQSIKKLMGWDNLIKIYLAKLLAFLMDLKYKKRVTPQKK